MSIGGALNVNGGFIGLGPSSPLDGEGRATASDRVLIGIAIGNSGTVAPSEGVAVGQAAWAGTRRSVAIGWNARAAAGAASARAAIAIGENASAIDVGVAIGFHASQTTLNGIAIGREAKSTQTSAIALGYNANASNSAAVAIGQNTNAAGSNGVALGTTASAGGEGAFAGGQNARALGRGAAALGANTLVDQNAAESIALGLAANAEHAFSVALGSNSRTAAAVAYPTASLAGNAYTFAGGAPTGVVSVGSAAQQRQIVNLASGRISGTSTDAINGSQMFAAFTEIGALNNRASALAARDVAQQAQIDALLARPAGGNADLGSVAQAVGVALDPDGQLQQPEMDLLSLGSAAVQPQNLLEGIKALDAELVKKDAALGTLGDGLMQMADGVAENAAAVQANTDALATLQDRIEKGELGLVQQDATTRAITVGRDTDGARVDVSGEGGTRALEGLTNARLTADSTEAVTGAQLSATNDALAGVDARVASNRDDIAKNAGDVARNTAELAAVKAEAQAAADAAQGAADSAQASADVAQATATRAVAAAGTAQATADAAAAAVGTVNSRLESLADDSLQWNSDIAAFDARHAEQATSRIANVAAGEGDADAVNVGQLKAVGAVAEAAKTTADTAQVAATAATRNAEAARGSADAAQAAATQALAVAGTAQKAADEAKAAAGSAGTQLAGIGPSETVVERIQAVGQSVADALGGGAVAAADGTVSAPAYAVSTLQADGTDVGATRHDNAGAALSALDANIGVVNSRVDALADDSLRWNQEMGAFDARHADQTSSRIGNVAAGVGDADAVNVGQLKTVRDIADTAQSTASGAVAAAGSAQEAASAAQGTADRAVIAAASAQHTADGAQSAATTARNVAESAQAAANEAQAAAGSASAQLAGIGADETVAQRIRASGESVAQALGGGASANADGTVSAPAYDVAVIGADGTVAPATRHGNAGDALSALGSNIAGVNTRVGDLARDSLQWDEALSAYDAGHGNNTSSRIANVSAGVDAGDAVNVGQLTQVGEVAAAAQTAAEVAQRSAGTAQASADGALTAAASAQTAADAAQGSADAARGAADTAMGTANSAVSAAASAQATADRGGAVADEALQIARTAGDGVADVSRKAEQTRNQIQRGEIGLVQQDPTSKAITLGKDGGGTTVHLAGTEGERRLTGVAAGRIDDDSTDAVNGAQVAALSKRLQRADALTGGVAVDTAADGSDASRVTAGSRAVAIGSAAVAEGAEAVAIGQGARAAAGQSTAIGAQAVATAANSVALGAGSRADRPNTVSVGAEGAERQITHVAPATRDFDAVNLRQAKALSRQEASWALVEANGYTDRQVAQLRREANAGIALSMSMAGLPTSFVAGGRMIAMAGSTYGGESAVALGYSAVSEDGSFMFRASGSTTTEDHGFTVGVGFQW